jgi:hypothetical protein
MPIYVRGVLCDGVLGMSRLRWASRYTPYPGGQMDSKPLAYISRAPASHPHRNYHLILLLDVFSWSSGGPSRAPIL